MQWKNDVATHDGVPATGGNVDILNPDPAAPPELLRSISVGNTLDLVDNKARVGRSVPVNLSNEEEEKDDWESEVRLEESDDAFVGGELVGSDGPGCNDELEDEDEEAENVAVPCTDDAEGRLPGELFERVASVLPSGPEADGSKADGSPGEYGGKTREGEEPVEDVGARGRVDEEGEETHCHRERDGGERATFAVNVSEKPGCLTGLGETEERTRSGVDGRVADRQDRDENDGVEDGGQAVDLRVADGNDERRGAGIVRRCAAAETRVGRVDAECHHEQRKDVEEKDTRKDLLGGLGDFLARVTSLGSCETDEFCTCKRESGGDKDRAEALETVKEGALFRVPVSVSERDAVGRTTGSDDDTEDDEADHCDNLDH